VGLTPIAASGRMGEKSFYQQELGSRWLLLAPVIVVLSVALSQHSRLDFFFGFTLRNVLVALCIDRRVT